MKTTKSNFNAITAEEIDWLDVTTQEDAVGKGSYAIVYPGTYQGQPAAIKLCNAPEADTVCCDRRKTN